MSNKNYGVIQEQGFVVGNGLGFQPVKENELNPNPQQPQATPTPNKTQEPQKTKEPK